MPLETQTQHKKGDPCVLNQFPIVNLLNRFSELSEDSINNRGLTNRSTRVQIEGLLQQSGPSTNAATTRDSGRRCSFLLAPHTDLSMIFPKKLMLGTPREKQSATT